MPIDPPAGCRPRRTLFRRLAGALAACAAGGCTFGVTRNDQHVVQTPTHVGEDRFAVVDGRNLHYVELGSGPPVVLIPGAFSTYRVWSRVLPALAEHHRVIAIDYLGAGDSDKPEEGFGYTVAEQADVVAQLVRELRLEAPILVGVSYGSSIALDVAARHRDLPAMVCCIEGGALIPVEQLHYSSCFGAFGIPVLRETFLTFIGTGWFDRIGARVVMGSAWDRLAPAEQAEIVAIQSSYFATATCEATYRIYRTITSEIDLSAEMEGVRTPILYLYGDESRYRDIAETNVAFFRSRGLDAETIEVTTGVHDLELQYPAEVARILLGRWSAPRPVARSAPTREPSRITGPRPMPETPERSSD
jgi:pimeloyl-ACP methyl ester carboxylesterase